MSDAPKVRLVSIGGKPAVYQEQVGERWLKRFWVRPTINKHRTWVLLKATERRAAHAEAARRKIAPKEDSFDYVAGVYRRARCPTKKRKWQPRAGDDLKHEEANLESLGGFYGGWTLNDINLASLQKYFDWRTHGLKECDRPARLIELEIQTLSNVLNYAVFITEQIEVNKIRSNRPKFHTTKTHARDRKPDNAEAIHAIAEEMFNSVRSEVFVWLGYFAMFTGCRISELLRLRLDAGERGAGYIRRTAAVPVPEYKAIYTSHGTIHLGRRSKQSDKIGAGVKPECNLWPEFEQMLDSFLYWHDKRFPDSPYYFPGLSGILPVAAASWNHALNRVKSRLGLPHITPHGFRAYFTTKLIRDGFRYEEVAEMIGDKTVELLRAGYSDLAGGERLSWLPKTGLPGWQRWQPESKKVIAMRNGL